MAIVDKYISHITPLGSSDTYKLKAYLLKNGRTFKVQLNSTNASTAFDGSANITDIGVTGMLQTANGGTGNNSFTENRVIYSETATKLSSANSIYADATHMSINKTSITSNYNFEVNGPSIYDGNIRLNNTVLERLIESKKTGGPGWARDIISILDNEGTSFAHVGALGSANDFTYLYIGTGAYNSADNLRIYPASDSQSEKIAIGRSTQTASSAVVYIGGTAGEYTFRNRTRSPKLFVDGETMLNGGLNSSSWILTNVTNNTTTPKNVLGDGSYYLYGNNVQYGRLYIASMGLAPTENEGTYSGASAGHARLVLGNGKINANSAEGEADNAYGDILLYYGSENYAIYEPGLIYHTNNSNLDSFQYLGARSTTENTDAYATWILGNSTNKTSASAHSEGRLRIYSAATQYHEINGISTTTARTHVLPNATGWVVTAGDGSSTGQGGIEQPVYVDATGVVKNTTYHLKAHIEDGTQYRAAYYSDSRAIEDAGSIYMDDSHIGVNGTNTSYQFYVNGASYFNGNVDIDGITRINREKHPSDAFSTSIGITPLNIFGLKNGYPVYTDPEFASGVNSVGVYNNSSGGAVVHTRQLYSAAGIPHPGTSNGYVITIQTNGTASPGVGGFVQTITSRANAIFVQIFRALIPVGRNVINASNSMGSNYTDKWLTSQAGTGKWEWYARIIHCGASGTFSSGGHVYLDGDAGTSSAPVTWHLAFCNLYDITKGEYDGLRVREADTATRLQHITVNNTTLHNTAGTFAFSGGNDPWPGNDWVGLQIGDNVDKFQLVRINSNNLLFRQNDNGGTNASWGDWEKILTDVNTSWAAWTPGTTAGPQANLSLSGTTITSAAIPSASTSASGIVTTGAQTFANVKTFQRATSDANADGVIITHGKLQITNYGKILHIGSANSGWYHFVGDDKNIQFYFDPSIQVNGYIAPYSDSNFDVGLTDHHWRVGYFDQLRVSTDTGFTAANSGKGGTEINSGSIELVGSTPFIDFHQAYSTDDRTGRIIQSAAAGMEFSGTAATTAVNVNSLASAQKPLFKFIGETFINGILDVSGNTNLTNNVYISSTSTNRARLYLRTYADQPNDLWLGANNIDKWSITCRNSTENYLLGIYSAAKSYVATFAQDTGVTTINYGLEVKGHIATSNTATTLGARSGGGYHSSYNNIVLYGDASTGSSGLVFLSSKGTANNNMPSDRAFIQYHALGITTASADGTNPTLVTTSGESGKLVIGIGNDADDQVWLQVPSRIGLIKQVVNTSYVIPDTNNTTGTVGTATRPVYVNAGAITQGTYELKATINSGTANQVAYYSANDTISSTSLSVSDPTASGSGITYIASISQNSIGKITATKSTVRDASASQSGVVSTGTQTFAGNKTFNDSLVINANKNYPFYTNDNTFFVNKAVNWNSTSYYEWVYLLIPVLTATNQSAMNYIDGTFYLWKTGGNVYDNVHVNLNCCYNALEYYLESYGQGTDWKLVRCTYNGIQYYALKGYYHANPYTHVTFTGHVRSDLAGGNNTSTKSLNLPYAVAYYNYTSNSANAVVLNSEIKNSLTDTLTNTYVTSVTRRGLSNPGGFIGNASTASKLTDITTADAASSSATWRYVWFSYNDNTTGRPAYSSNLVFQTSTNTLKATKFQGALVGNADTATKLASTGTTGQFWRGDNAWSNILVGPLRIGKKGAGIELTDSADAIYGGIWDNGSNLWIGTKSSSDTIHTGGLYLHAGKTTDGKINQAAYLYAGASSTATSATGYVITHGSAGGGTQPVYVDSAGRVIKTSYELNATINSGVTNYLAYYSGTNTIDDDPYLHRTNNYLYFQRSDATAVGLISKNSLYEINFHVAASGNRGIYQGAPSGKWLLYWPNNSDIGYVQSGGLNVNGGLRSTTLITNYATKTAWNDGKAGAYIGADGTIQLTHATGEAYIGLHRAGNTAATGYVQTSSDAAVSLGGTEANLTYNSRTIATTVKLNGATYCSSQFETPAYFMVNGSAANGSRGFYLYNHQVQYARLFVSTVGTVATASAAGTAGIASLYLGNATAQPAAGATTAGANNAYGRILLYGTGTNYTILRSNPNGDRTMFLPEYGGTGYLVCRNTDGGVGTASTPVYVDANGCIQACTAYGSATDIRAKTVYINDDTSTKLYVLGATTTGYTNIYRESSVTIESNILKGAAWNDYAEYRQAKNNSNISAGKVVYENGDDTLSISTQRLMRGCNIVSDTYGFAIGESEKAQLPIAVSGRVLAYPYESREKFKNHIGWPVCSGPNGTVSIMTEEEEMKYPSRIIGIISAVPDYEIWHGGVDIVVDGRVWIKVK